MPADGPAVQAGQSRRSCRARQASPARAMSRRHPEAGRDILVARRLRVESLEIETGALGLAGSIVRKGSLVAEGMEQLGRPIGGPMQGLREQCHGRVGQVKTSQSGRAMKADRRMDRRIVRHVLPKLRGLR